MQRFFNNVISPRYRKSQAQFSIDLAERMLMSNHGQQVSIRSHRPKPFGPLMKFTQRSVLYRFMHTTLE